MTKPAGSYVVCPHCIAKVPLKPRCKKCRGVLSFDEFRARMAQICALERTFNLKDLRSESGRD